MFKRKKALIPNPVIPNLQTFNCDENNLLNRIQGGNRIPLHWRGDREVGVVSIAKHSAFTSKNVIPNLQTFDCDENNLLNRIQGGNRIPLHWRGDREVGVVSMAKRSAFTLAEVLITLGIIGVVSAMTLPSLVSNYQYKALDTKKTLFENRLEEAMNQMRFHEKLTGYDDAEGFVAELGKYLKINETCDSTNMSDCFPSITINS
ncbi:MAG: type II secretion system protein, partial [Candidatus Gastranaerophilales bacterium]